MRVALPEPSAQAAKGVSFDAPAALTRSTAALQSLTLKVAGTLLAAGSVTTTWVALVRVAAERPGRMGAGAALAM